MAGVLDLNHDGPGRKESNKKQVQLKDKERRKKNGEKLEEGITRLTGRSVSVTQNPQFQLQRTQ